MSKEPRTPASKSRSVRTCTECKQAKLRCDSKDNFPNPCSRCKARQLFCTIDAAFQRTPARKRLEAMSREIQELRNMREGDTVGSSSQPETDVSYATEHVPEALPENNLELGDEMISLDDLIVETSLVVDAFENFIELFHHQLPLVEPIVLHHIYRSQPVLFWTILIIVSSHLPEDPYIELYPRLYGPYTRLLKEEAMNAPLPLHKIQALVLLCAWPLPVDSQVKDSSWVYCGIAIQAARYMGLDREQPLPTSRTVGVLPGAGRARINTWLGCFYVSTSISLHLGLQPPIISDPDFATIKSFLSKKTVPVQIATQVRIHLIVAKFTNILLQSSTDTMTTSLIRLINNEFDPLKSAFEDNGHGSRRIEFSILVAKLHFYALAITKLSPTSSSREVLLQNGLAAALRLINIAAIPKSGGTSDTGETRISAQRQRCMPKNYYRGLAFATIFLITFSHLNAEASQDERQSAVTHISLSQDIFRACSLNPLDEYARAAKMFEILARLPPGSSDPAKLRLTHRMGVSIMVNALRIADEARGRPTELVENRTPEDQLQSIQAQDQGPQQDTLSAFDYTHSYFGFLKEFWEDPIMNMLDLDSMYSTQELSL